MSNRSRLGPPLVWNLWNPFRKENIMDTNNLKPLINYLFQQNIIPINTLATSANGAWTLTHAVGSFAVGTVFQSEAEMRDRIAVAILDGYQRVGGLKAAS
jgi:hypothetical protein